MQTIYAQSTPVGMGGIAIIRLSGPHALAALNSVFVPKHQIKPRMLTYGHIQDEHGNTIDEAMAVYLPAPNTYTREDMAEIHCHGSHAAVAMLMQALSTLDLPIRAAEPGEFTKRAFLNGRLDLTEAEAVMDIISAQSQSAQKSALHQLSGSLSAMIIDIKTQLLTAIAANEAAVDFPEDDWDQEAIQSGNLGYQQAKVMMEQLLATYQDGRMTKHGIRCAIVGRPNVGKSSLLNAIAGFERALVSDVPGTTRDALEETIIVQGTLIRLIDTAGIRQSGDMLEQRGMDFAKRSIQSADIAILVLDGATPLDDYDAMAAELIGDIPTLVAINKSDLSNVLTEGDAKRLVQNPLDVMQISAVSGDGITELFGRVVHSMMHYTAEDATITSQRHYEQLTLAHHAIETAVKALQSGQPSDIAALDAKVALRHLGMITGDDVDEDVINDIFANFCVGK